MSETLKNITKDVEKPLETIAMAPLRIGQALFVDPFLGKNPLTRLSGTGKEVATDVVTAPINVAKNVIVGTTRFALSALWSTVTGTAKGIGRTAMKARVIPGV